MNNQLSFQAISLGKVSKWNRNSWNNAHRRWWNDLITITDYTPTQRQRETELATLVHVSWFEFKRSTDSWNNPPTDVDNEIWISFQGASLDVRNEIPNGAGAIAAVTVLTCAMTRSDLSLVHLSDAMKRKHQTHCPRRDSVARIITSIKINSFFRLASDSRANDRHFFSESESSKKWIKFCL